jgi:nucleotidyltransferase substrate binding protein (TIGR01987 family)
MEINKSIEIFVDALKTLSEGIELFYEYKDILNGEDSEQNHKLFNSMRDSLIQRFEYCTDLFWKVVRIYLINIEKMDVPNQSPRGIIRQAMQVGIFSEDQGSICMDMVEARNKTSHTYHEVIADEIAHQVPGYHDLMNDMIHCMQDAIKNA